MTGPDKTKIKLKQMKQRYETEREKVNAYGQIVKMYSAYIGLLLQKLGATKDAPVKLLHDDITKAMDEFETRALSTEAGFEMYVEVVSNELNLSATASDTTRETTDKP